MRTLTRSTCTTVIGTPSPAKIATAKSATSPRFAESRKATNFRMLSAMARPSRIAATIVAKSSSVRTRSADSRAASVPAAAHCHPDIRQAKGRCVVDAVAGDCDHLSPVLQGLDEAQLLGGRHARMDRGLGQAERAADGLGGQWMVSRHHLHPQACRARFLDRFAGALPEGIVQGDEPDEGEPDLERVVVHRRSGELALRRRRAPCSPLDAHSSATASIERGFVARARSSARARPRVLP